MTIPDFIEFCRDVCSHAVKPEISRQELQAYGIAIQNLEE
jgi:hypothetical protein